MVPVYAEYDYDLMEGLSAKKIFEVGQFPGQHTPDFKFWALVPKTDFYRNFCIYADKNIDFQKKVFFFKIYSLN